MQFTQLPPLCCAEGSVDSAGLKPKVVIPDLIRHPEGFEFTGFRLQFTRTGCGAGMTFVGKGLISASSLIG